MIISVTLKSLESVSNEEEKLKEIRLELEKTKKQYRIKEQELMRKLQDEINKNSHSPKTTFLSELHKGNVEIFNQSFNLYLSGIIYQEGHVSPLINNNNDYYGDEDSYIHTEILWNNDFKLNHYADGVAILDTSGYPDILPTFEFLKGKLLEIKTNSKKKDYLFSYNRSGIDEHGYSNLIFNLTDDDENGYTIPTIIINNNLYLIMNNNFMSKLGFEIPLNKNNSYSIDILKNKDYYMVDDKILDDETGYYRGDSFPSLFFLFELIENN